MSQFTQFAQDLKQQATDAVNSVGTSTGTDVAGIVSNVISILSFVVGAISVIMILVGGVRYTLAAGDPNNAKAAKDTILYALVGLVVALAAQGLVAFVISRF